MKNKLVQWKGGGYDGCFWEPNTGFFDSVGKWHPIISTGFGKRDTIEEFNKASKEDDIVLPITKNGLLEFAKNIRDDFAIHTLKELENAGYTVYWKCSQCGTIFDEMSYFSSFESYRGDGGIGIINQGPICDECWSIGTCSECNEYIGVDDLEHGLCEYCLEKKMKSNPELSDEIEQLEEDIQNSEKELKLYKRVRPRYSKSASETVKRINTQRYQRIEKLKSKIAGR